MNKVLEEASNNIDNNSDKTEGAKKLCVHDLRRRLKESQKKKNINKVIILLIAIFFISFLALLIY